MSLSSLELASRCHDRGLLSKEAMDQVLRVRERLIRASMAKQAAGVFSNVGKRVSGAVAKGAKGAKDEAGGFFADMKRGLGFAGTPKEVPKGDPAHWGSAASYMTKMLGLGGLLAAGGAGVTGVLNHSRDKSNRKDIESSFVRMFDEAPRLRDHDPEIVRRHFDVLARYAPSMAADPTVAGGWVQSTVTMRHIDVDAVKKLSDAQAMVDKHNQGKALFQPGHFSDSLNLARMGMNAGGGGGGGGE